MAIAPDSASNSGYKANTGSYVFSFENSAGDYLRVSLTLFIPEVIFANPEGPSVKWNGIDLELLHEAISLDGTMMAQLWGIEGIAVETSADVEIELAGTNYDSIASASSYSGVHQTTSTGWAASARGTTGPASVQIDTIVNGFWLLDAIATSDTSMAVGAGQTQRSNVSGALGSGGSSDEGPNAPESVIEISWTGISSSWVAVAIALLPADEAAAYALSAGSGAFAMTGQTAGLRVARKIVPEGGDDAAFNLTGQPAGLRVSRKVSAASGAFTFTGQNAGLRAGMAFSATSGAFSFDGQSATLRSARNLKAGVEGDTEPTWAFTGQAATLTIDRRELILGAAGGVFVMTGQATAYRITRVLTAASGEFVFTGQEVAFDYPLFMGAASGSFAFVGQDVGMLRSRVMGAGSGMFGFFGHWVYLNYSHNVKGSKTTLVPDPSCCCDGIGPNNDCTTGFSVCICVTDFIYTDEFGFVCNLTGLTLCCTAAWVPGSGTVQGYTCFRSSIEGCEVEVITTPLSLEISGLTQCFGYGAFSLVLQFTRYNLSDSCLSTAMLSLSFDDPAGGIAGTYGTYAFSGTGNCSPSGFGSVTGHLTVSVGPCP